MLKSYLKIALRNLRRYKQYALINIVGLAVSLVCLIFILLFVKHEWSFDRFQANANRIYRVAQDVYFRGAWVRVAVTPPIMAPALPKEFPEIEQAGRVLFMREQLIARGNKKFTADLQFVDPEIVPLMSINMIAGNAEALRRSQTVALSQTWAQKLFGSENPIGQTLRLDNRLDVEVIGVFRDYPETSHLFFGVMISIETLRKLIGPGALQNENSNNYYTYILLDEHAKPTAVEAKLPAFIRKFYGENGPQTRRVFLEPLSSIYLYSETLYDVRSSGNAYYLYILLAVALAVLGIACMNFINLATAQSLRRAREIGVRKVCGANRWAIIRQFLAESVIVGLLAFALALAMAELLLPVFATLIHRAPSFSLLSDPWFMLALLGIVVLVALLSGLYPAAFMSAFTPTQALKNQHDRRVTGLGGFGLRKGLVVVQFASSAVLLVCSTLIFQQVNFLRTKDLGFARENIFFVSLRSPEARNNFEVIKTELQRQPGVKSVCGTSTILGSPVGEWLVVEPSGKDTTVVKMLFVDYDFVKTFNLTITAGRAFRRDMATDRTAFLVNSRAAKMFGGGKILGKEINVPGEKRGRIIGIVSDFNYEPLRVATEPLVITLGLRLRYLVVRTHAGQLASVLRSTKKMWQRLAPEDVFEFTILDQHLDRLYRSEQRLAQLVTIFTGFAIFITCLGLFGLLAIIVLQRRKEIGIRKVLGATVANVVTLLSRDFVKLVVLANLIAWPVAWWAMNKWLQNFAYRIEISWWVFALAGGLTLVIALVTVSTQAVRAALANPVESLRYE